MSGILKQQQPVLVREGPPRAHVHHVPAEVHKHHGSGPRRELPLCILKRHVRTGYAFDVHEHRCGSDVNHDIRGCNERQRGDQYFVARPDVESLQTELQCRCCGVNRNRIFDFMQSCECLFKTTHAVAHGQPAVDAHLAKRSFLGLSKRGRSEFDQGFIRLGLHLHS